MKKVITLCLCVVLILSMVSCQSNDDKTNDLIKRKEIGKLVSEKGYTEQDFNDNLLNRHRDELVNSWGEPDGHLSGPWGDIWNLNNTNDKYIIILYYNAEGYVFHIVINAKETATNP